MYLILNLSAILENIELQGGKKADNLCIWP